MGLRFSKIGGCDKENLTREVSKSKEKFKRTLWKFESKTSRIQHGNRYLMMSDISNLPFIPSSLKESNKILMRHQDQVILLMNALFTWNFLWLIDKNPEGISQFHHSLSKQSSISHDLIDGVDVALDWCWRFDRSSHRHPSMHQDIIDDFNDDHDRRWSF